MKQSMTEDADAEGEINQIVFAELVNIGKARIGSLMSLLGSLKFCVIEQLA
jgi:hypothetical protein